MRLTPTPERASPAIAGALVRDRLTTFRRLCLGFAVFTVASVAATLGFVPETTAAQRNEAITTAILLISLWLYGHSRERLSPAWLPVEIVTLIGFVHGIANPIAVLGVCYVGVQYRALYGDRRDASFIGGAYIAAFVLGLAFMPHGPGVMRPVVVVQVVAIGFCAYLLHTLADVLRRDHERTTELRESEQRFRSVAENLREALMITDTEDRIILANTRVRDVLGYEPADVLGKTATELLLPESQRNVFRDRLRRRLHGESELYEVELIRKDGKRIHAEVSASPYRDASGQIIGTLGAISDISEQKRLEERLRQGMRMEAVGQLAGGVAHDFNNLLTVIKCHAELLLADLPHASQLRDGIVEIERSADRGATLTQQLLAFSRKQLLQPRLITLVDVVTDSAPILRRLISDNVLMVTVHDESADHVFADPLQLEHVLVTLVRNANDAMPKGGRITIETRALELTGEHPPVATQEMPNGRYAMLSVADTGVGMSREVMARLFEPFFTTKKQGEGTGLGLASMYGVVRQSGGYVDVESSPKAGTTFRVYLPLTPQGVGATAMLPATSALQRA